MLLFGHLFVTLGIFFGLAIFIPRLKTVINPRYLAIGAILPDLIDKPIGEVIFASTFGNGRIVGHTLLFSLLLFLAGLYLYDKEEISGLFLFLLVLPAHFRRSNGSRPLYFLLAPVWMEFSQRLKGLYRS